MAYKVQISDANLRGSIVAPEDVAITGELTGSNVTADANVTAGHGLIKAGGSVVATTAFTHYNDDGTSNKFIELSHATNDGKIELFKDNTSQVDVQLSVDGDGGMIKVGANGSFLGTLDADEAAFTGSAFHVTGAMNIGGDLTLTDVNLRVAGTTTTFTGELNATDDEIVIGSGSSAAAADMDQSGILLGFDGTGGASDAGLGILYRTSGTKFQIKNMNNDASALYGIKADKFYGDGSGLTGFSFQGYAGVVASASAGTYHLQTSQVTSIFHAVGNGEYQFYLPNPSSLANGDFFVFKNGNAASSAIKLRASGSGTTLDGIDIDSGNVTIADTDAAFIVFTDGSDYFLE